MMIDDDNYLCKYTSLPFLFEILENKELTFVNPKNWEDRNDSYFFEVYKRFLNKNLF